MNNCASLQPSEGPKILLYKEQMLLGREEDCDIVIPNQKVSRQHAVIERKGSQYTIRDLDSRNGTFINLIRIGPQAVKLKNRDRVSITAKIHFVFCASEETLDDVSEIPILQKQKTINYNTGVRVDRESHEVWVDSVLIRPRLSPKCFALLELLTREPGRLYSYEEIHKHLWPQVDYYDNTDRDHCHVIKKQLVQALQKSVPGCDYIQSINKQGMKIMPPVNYQK